MSGELVCVTMDHAPRGLSPLQRLILCAIAEQVRDGHRCRAIPRSELCRKVGEGPGAVTKAIARMASEHGVEVRVVVGHDNDGRPYFAHRGRAITYELPRFEPPEGCTCQHCSGGNKGGQVSDLPEPGSGGKGRHTSTHSGEKGSTPVAKGWTHVRERADTCPPHPVPVGNPSARGRARGRPAEVAAPATPLPPRWGAGSGLPACPDCDARAGDPAGQRMRPSADGALRPCECRTMPRLQAVADA